MRRTAADVLIVGCDGPYGTAIAKRLGSDGFRVAGVFHGSLESGSGIPTIPWEGFQAADLSGAISRHLPGFSPERIVFVPRPPKAARISDLVAEELISAADEALLRAEGAARYLLSNRAGSGPARLVLLSGWAAMGLPYASTAAVVMGGLLGLARSWGLELAPGGITVNAVVAGAGVVGSNWDRSLPPIGHHPTEEEVAHAVAFLLDERSIAVNGQVLFVCGGLTPGIIPV